MNLSVMLVLFNQKSNRFGRYNQSSTDEEMEALGQTCLDDSKWNPMTQVGLIFTLSTFINVVEIS